MKKNQKILLAAGFILSIMHLSAQQKGDSFASAQSSKTANITYVHASVNGFATTDQNGDPTGLLVELMNEFEQFVNSNYGITINGTYVAARNKDFKIYLDEVKNASGGVFGLSNTSIKEERKKILQFSPAFLNNISVLISNKSFATLSSLDNIGSAFNGKTGYAVPSTTNHARMIDVKRTKFPSMNIVQVNSSKAIVENVAGDSDGYGFVDIHYYLEFLNQGEPIKRHPVGDQTGDKFGIIMPMNSDWGPVITEFLNTGILKSPKYRQMVIDNLGKGALRMLN